MHTFALSGRVAVLMLCATLSAQTAASQITIGSSVLVSGAHPTRSFYEYLAGADPTNSKRLMVCTMSLAPEKSAKWVALYTSFDGGKTWKPTLEDKRTNWVGDPTCRYGRGDTAFASTLPIFGGTKMRGSEMTMYRSVDGGRTWGEPVVMPFIDRQYVNVDRTNDRFAGRVYLHANGMKKDNAGKTLHPQPQIVRSLDGGMTFSAPVGLEPADFYTMAIPGDGVIMGDGTLIFPLWASRKGETGGSLEVIWSDDGGASLSAPVVVGKYASDCGSLPTLAMDPSTGPFSGRLYVVYGDKEHERCVIKVVSSSDRGRSWSGSVTVSDDIPRAPEGKGPDNFLPSIEVNKNGVVGVVWYDRRNYRDNIGHALRFAASLDGGVSFTPSVAVSPYGLDLSRQSSLPFHTYTRSDNPNKNLQSVIGLDESYMDGQGDTQGFVVDADGVFHPFWIDNRNGSPQLYTTTVSVKGSAVRHGDASLSSLNDLTESVTLTYGRSSFDARTRIVAVEVVMRNLSERPIGGPLKLRAVGVRSMGGTPVVLNADNGAKGAGAIWDFTKALTGGVLQPGADSRPVTLRFRLDNYSHAKLDRRLAGPYLGRGVMLESRVLGTLK